MLPIMYSRRFVPVAAFVLLVGGLLAAWQFAIGGLVEGDEKPSVEGLAEDGAAWNLSRASAQLPEGTRFIYKEFTSTADTVWLALAEDPAQRVPLANIEHAAAIGAKANLSPDSDRVAYVTLSGRSRASEVWVADLDAGKSQKIADGANIRVAPVWNADASTVAFLRETSAEKILVQADAEGNGEAVLVADDAPGLYPIGYALDNSAFYYARVASGGTDIGVVSLSDGSASIVAHASDHIARERKLSPDGQSIVYLAPQFSNGRVQYAAFALPLDGGAPSPIASQSEPETDQLGFAWRPNSDEITVGDSQPASGMAVFSLTTGENLETLSAPPQGLDVPVAWSKEGEYLAVRSFEKAGTGGLADEKGVIVSSNGERKEMQAAGQVEFVGWVPSGS